MYDQLQRQSTLFNLMGGVQQDLVDPSPLFARPKNCPRPTRGDPNKQFDIAVRGKLVIGDIAAENTYPAECIIVGSEKWENQPLKVFCTETWIRRETDWHLVKDPSGWFLCYEFHERWADRIAKVKKVNDQLKTAQFAQEFCLRASRDLIEKHLFAFRQNIKKWPKQWDAWPHGWEAAMREYRQELRLTG
jgi:hypothetical protein